jgi:ATPase subunit of ABC transporter with duplicated ATPase domains
VTAVIEAEALGKRYRGQWALTDCTLSVPAGHVVGLVGLNGAGKTTLLNLASTGFAGCRGGCGRPADAFLGQLSNLTPFGGPQAFRLLPAGANLYVIVYTVGILFILIAPRSPASSGAPR